MEKNFCVKSFSGKARRLLVYFFINLKGRPTTLSSPHLSTTRHPRQSPPKTKHLLHGVRGTSLWPSESFPEWSDNFTV